MHPSMVTFPKAWTKSSISEVCMSIVPSLLASCSSGREKGVGSLDATITWGESVIIGQAKWMCELWSGVLRHILRVVAAAMRLVACRLSVLGGSAKSGLNFPPLHAPHTVWYIPWVTWLDYRGMKPTVFVRIDRFRMATITKRSNLFIQPMPGTCTVLTFCHSQHTLQT